MGEAIKIAAVDDHPLFLNGLKFVLRGDVSIKFVAEGTTADDACRIASEVKPDVMLIDVSMPGNGLNAVRHISAHAPSVKTVLLSASNAHQDVAQALAAGAKGYIVKGASGSDLRHAIKSVHDGETFISGSLVRHLIVDAWSSPDSKPQAAEPCAKLNHREAQIMSAVAKGLTNREIAAELNLAIPTIKTYVSRILEKLQVRSRIDAIRSFQNH